MGENVVMAETYVFGDDSAESVLGPNDRNLSYLELILGSDLAVRVLLYSATIISFYL